MKTRILLIITVLLFCVSCGKKAEMQQANKTADASTVEQMDFFIGQMDVSQMESLSDKEVTDKELDLFIDSISQSMLHSGKRPLNEIRFENWTDADWYDNDYFRFLRKTFDDCYKGIENEDTNALQDYKSLFNQQFYVYQAEPFMMGGIFLSLGFLEESHILYQTAVYSYVNEETETITGYELRGFRKSQEVAEFTKEDIIRITTEHPEFKLY